jgi:hypothetical protein
MASRMKIIKYDVDEHIYPYLVRSSTAFADKSTRDSLLT